MNERFEQMMLEATKDMPQGYYVPGEYFQKFAELIVRECISVMDNTAKEAQENFTYMDNDVPTTAHQFEIRKHFGVEK